MMNEDRRQRSEWPLALVLAAAGGWTSRAPLVAESSPWQAVAPGLEVGRLASPQPAPIGSSLVTVVRVDPERYEFRLLSAKLLGLKDNPSAPEWVDRNGVLGVVKAYLTRVGEGPMPTELTGASGERLRESGMEYGAVTGRPRRCGWYDAVIVRYAARINGLDSVALTKLDVLDGLEAIQVCTGYRRGRDLLSEWPADIGVLAGCEPIYETLPGWTGRTRGVTKYHDLPREAQGYVAYLEEVTGVPISIVSTGSGRGDTIIREQSAAAAWFGQVLRT